MLLIVFPLALVPCSFHILVYALAIRFIIHPSSFIGVFVGMKKRTLAVRLIILPHAFIPGSIRPLHCAFSVAQATEPLALIGGSSFVGVFPISYRLISVVLFTLAKRLHGFIFLEIPSLHLGRHGNDSVLSSVEPAPNQCLDPGYERYIFPIVDVLVLLGVVSETFCLTITSIVNLFHQTILVALSTALTLRFRRDIPGVLRVLVGIILAYGRLACVRRDSVVGLF
jgi:hypothetical protein